MGRLRARTRGRLAKSVLELALAHLRTAFYPARLRSLIKLLLRGMSVAPGSRTRRPAPAHRATPGILAAHAAAALAATARPDVRFPFLLLLRGFATCFFSFRLCKGALVFGLALVFRRTGFAQGDCDGLTAARHLAASPARPALELAVLELMHDTTRRLALPWAGSGHCRDLSRTNRRRGQGRPVACSTLAAVAGFHDMSGSRQTGSEAH